MNQEQSEEILEHLLEAATWLDEARAAMDLLTGKDAASLKKIIVNVNSKLLDTIYERFRDLVPFEEFPAISSSLRWDQVQLPSSVSVTQIDDVISSVIVAQWRKMAFVITKAIDGGKELGLKNPQDIFAARIRALVDDGRFEGQGDLRKWRHSEVRLKIQRPN